MHLSAGAKDVAGQAQNYEPTRAISTYSFPGGARQDVNVTLWYDT